MESRGILADSPPFICLVRRVNLPSSDFSTLATYHPPHFLSDLQLYTKELILSPVYRPNYLQSELASDPGHMRTEGVTSMELSNLSLAPGTYENHEGVTSIELSLFQAIELTPVTICMFITVQLLQTIHMVQTKRYQTVKNMLLELKFQIKFKFYCRFQFKQAWEVLKKVGFYF